MKHRKFVISILIFFLPVLGGVLIAEYLSREITSGYKINSTYLNAEAGSMEVLILGSSQIKDGINVAILQQPSINMASGDQHHNTDFKLLKGLDSRLPKLTTVVLEVSYSHFELPHNSPDFWKNSVYYEYYGINAFERRVYFKDRLIFLSNPKYFAEKIGEQFHDKSVKYGYNTVGFDTLNYSGRFKDMNYDETKIETAGFKINLEPNLSVFDTNTTLFFEMLDYLKAKDLNVIICNPPMYRTFLKKRNREILFRRDSILNIVSEKYTNVSILYAEEDTINFHVKDFTNPSHLNPKGAQKFTSILQTHLDSLH
ncbi:hypothetical protein [Constantimarinum furrinae]|uniref:DUF1574 domain-containing protein n=1 Tax=Constantimarinum furrinae TaxID=2562285 RepID=A0A7G8PX54_9FLAO|nr:hypothetical protein [Constantimarinum furrinae]QNJ98920.1 hypothetical protein ALE3EI_2382 [Constantimarinum furrinae]